MDTTSAIEIIVGVSALASIMILGYIRVMMLNRK